MIMKMEGSGTTIMNKVDKNAIRLVNNMPFLNKKFITFEKGY